MFAFNSNGVEGRIGTGVRCAATETEQAKISFRTCIAYPSIPLQQIRSAYIAPIYGLDEEEAVPELCGMRLRRGWLESGRMNDG